MKFVWPIPKGTRITQAFGANPGSGYVCRADGSHNGVDFAVVEGTPVWAAADGVVIAAGMDTTGYGLHVRIQHDGVMTLYGHLRSLGVKAGDAVRAGQVIGQSGNTGNSTGQHLHFEVRTVAGDCHTCVDPMALLMAHGADYSHWQDNNSTPQKVDFGVAYAAGLRWVGIKVSQAKWTDEDYVYNWDAAARAGLARLGYHFLVWDVSPAEQARHFFDVTKNDRPELDWICDFEWWQTVPSNAISLCDQFCTEMEQLSGKPCGIYTAPAFWKQYGSKDAKWARRPLWIANWNVSSPSVPAPWATWTYWQYTNKGNGPTYGAESLDLDMNWFNGNEDEMRVYAGMDKPVDEGLLARVAALENQVVELMAWKERMKEANQ